MEAIRSERSVEKLPPLQGPVIPKTKLQLWFFRVCTCILIWTCLVQLVAVGELWHPRLLTGFPGFTKMLVHQDRLYQSSLPPPVPSRNYTSNGFLKVTCNGGLNQMRSAICDMVTIARLLNLTLVVPQLDKASFWADTSNFEDVFDVDHFINSLRDEIRIIKRLPKRYSERYGHQPLVMRPVSWSNEQYYLHHILPLFGKHKVIHFNRTDSRLANNGLPLQLQRLRCRVNFQALKFTPQIEALGKKLINIIQRKGPYLALHLRYEMDMLAFSGCTHGCTEEEANELKRMRYAFPWWREKEIVSEEKRSEGLCPLTPEETALILQAFNFDTKTQIYIASGEIYGSERRLAALRAAFPRIVRKEMLLHPGDLRQFQNHSSQMAALDFMVSLASDIFIPTYDGNMARVVEGYRRYLGFKKTFQLDRKRLVEFLDSHQNGTLTWDEFSHAVQKAHETTMGVSASRRVIRGKPKEEEYFYANPEECLCERNRDCDDPLYQENTTKFQ
ncbi:rhamnogalacturonan I rhamnosyltransferase 1-like [Andrographis paniculata]|uniref:rhamnogalacturonan I rhamnosyltransferase 1-like n=1 Tax=Andrographis paniculata TaxID=175694 RepID=UPI0021E89101|nr:rhamnogalacturonan I rhamnosyltransferase 1-like [Andrographis paniculata]